MRFDSSQDTTIGIELELQLLDAESLDLTDRIVPLMELYPKSDRVKPEFIQSCVEVTTPICATAEEASNQLRCLLRGVVRRCDDLGIVLCGGGTHPFGQRLGLITPTPRFLRMKGKHGIIARQQITFATHFHVGMPSGNAAMFVMRHLTPCLPVFLALGANSPFWRGHDTGYADYRHCILAASASYGLPRYFQDWDDFVRFVEMATRLQIIEDIKGIHWDLRPNPTLGTLELRVTDATSSLTAAAALGALVRSAMVYLVDHISEELARWPFRRQSAWLESMNRQQALWRGLDGDYFAEDGRVTPLREMAARLFDALAPTAAAIGEQRAFEMLKRWVAGGVGYERQRRARQALPGFRELVSLMARELRDDVENPDASSEAREQMQSGIA